LTIPIEKLVQNSISKIWGGGRKIEQFFWFIERFFVFGSVFSWLFFRFEKYSNHLSASFLLPA
jgi:hypothetical protein